MNTTSFWLRKWTEKNEIQQGVEGSRSTQQGSGLRNAELHGRSHDQGHPACGAVVLFPSSVVTDSGGWGLPRAESWEVGHSCSLSPVAGGSRPGWGPWQFSPSLPHLGRGCVWHCYSNCIKGTLSPEQGLEMKSSELKEKQ